MNRTITSVAALGLALVGSAAAAEKVKFEYWYGLSGDLGAVVLETCNRFNASQDQYEAVCVGQDSYDAAVQNTIAAFRAGQHPTLVQSFDAGTADLMLSGEFYPVQTMMKDFGIEIDWANYFPGIANYYAASTGELFSMPFNSSTAMYYYNVDQLAKAGITTAPDTWEQMEEAFNALKTSGSTCPMAYAPSTWIDLEQFSMVHNVPVATNDNGYSGLDTTVEFNNTLHVTHMENIKRWLDEGLLQLRTTQSGVTQRDAFLSGECAIFFSSIADHATVGKLAAESLNWEVAMIPHYADFPRHNTVVGGASNWVLSKKTEEEYRAAAAYLAFLATPESEEFWVSNTGYIPVTKSGYDALLAKGFYDAKPYKGRDLALKSLNFTPPTNLTRGIRLGGMIQIRSEWTNEIDAALAGQKTMKEALDTAAERSNAILARFAKTYAGKTFP